MSALFSDGNVSRTLKSIESTVESAPHWSASIFHFIRRLSSRHGVQGDALSVHSGVGSRRYYPSRLITLYSEMAVVFKDDNSGHTAWKWNKRMKRHHSQFVLYLKIQRLLLTIIIKNIYSYIQLATLFGSHYVTVWKKLDLEATSCLFYRKED